LKRAQRFGGDVSLLLLDIDHFKRVNDAHGHLAGDIALKQFAEQMTRCLPRATDWCARLGGEEFAVVLEGTNSAGARACAEKLRRAIANTRIDTPSGEVHITVSIGIGGLADLAGRDATTAHSLLHHADTNLYVSKAGGRNRVTWSSSDGHTAPACQPANQGSDHVKAKVPIHSVC
jgi:diguanylate cyclase (GGDEF)-like protein